MHPETMQGLTAFCCVLIFLPTAISLALSALIALLEWPIRETRSHLLASSSVLLGLSGSLGLVLILLSSGQHSLGLYAGDWISLPQADFQFGFAFLLDRLSLSFLILCQLLVGTVGAFARVYLHREAGFRRFYLFYLLFLLGLSLSALAGNIETLFIGWELVGFASVMLISFFQERAAAVRNSLRVWIIYRLADAAFLGAALVLHELGRSGDFLQLASHAPWPASQPALPAGQALLIGSLLVLAAAGKSALLPFSGWLPRAMEGPTPSSAVFYGALSIHLGAFLLLRIAPLLSHQPLFNASLIILGLTSAVWASLAMRVMPQIKGKLAYASLIQVGLIVAEIGLGLYVLALIHILGHALIRTLQFLRAPSLLHDLQQLENQIGESLHGTQQAQRQRQLYRLGYHHQQLDQMLISGLVQPFVLFFSRCEMLEQRWSQWLAGPESTHTEAGLDIGGLDR